MPTQAIAQQTPSPQATSLEQEQLNNFLGPVNGALGGLPVAERTSEYFAVYTGAGGTGPEIIDQTAVFISYLVDAKGNLSKPSTEYVSLDNLIQNFEVGKNVVLRNSTPSTSNGNIFGKQKITGIGRQVPILYSATGSTAGANISTLNFDGSLNQSSPSMLGNMTKTNINPDSSYVDYQPITGYNAPTIEPDPLVATYNNTNGTYSVISSGLGDVQFFKIKILAQISNNNNDDSFAVDFSIRRDGSEVATKSYTVPDDDELNIANGNDPFEFFVFGNALAGNPVFDVQVRFPNGGTDNLFIDFIRLQVSAQSPLPGFPDAVPPYWSTGSDSTNLYLTASAELSENYTNIQNSDPVTDLASANDFNLSSINVPFEVKVGDRIRFEYNMETDYIIYEVIEPGADPEGLLRLKLNQRIPNTVNRDNFILHRVDVNDPVYIILDVAKNQLSPGSAPFKGVILPEFPTQELKDNIDDLVLELKDKGILADS